MQAPLAVKLICLTSIRNKMLTIKKKTAYTHVIKKVAKLYLVRKYFEA